MGRVSPAFRAGELTNDRIGGDPRIEEVLPDCVTLRGDDPASLLALLAHSRPARHTELTVGFKTIVALKPTAMRQQFNGLWASTPICINLIY